MPQLLPSELHGLRDFLQFHNTDERLPFELARIICGNLCSPNTFEEAIDLVVLHSPSLASILNRKLVTKGLLFKYLSHRQIAATHDLTKQALIEAVIQHWTTQLPLPADTATTTTVQHHDDNHDGTSQHFPIHKMAREFTTWFYAQCNAATISANDFWDDARGHFEMVEQSTATVEEQLADGSQSVVDILLGLRHGSQLFFNPNVSHAGVQGRIDPHGLVMVLSCGTVHSNQTVLGCFESVFGLVSDPFAVNNWKLKLLKMRLKRGAAMASVADGAMVSTELVDLRHCETLQPMLALPHTNNDLD